MTTKPKRIQRKRTKGWKMPDNCVYVGRPTKIWGNPHKVGDPHPEHGEPMTAQEAVDLYSSRINKGMYRAKACIELGGKDLSCWCGLCEKHKDGKPLDEHCPDCKPCHVDPLGRIANGIKP